jgi:hypothetical protein
MLKPESLALYLSARKGDFTQLIGMLRSGAELSEEVRSLLADILQGKFRKDHHRPARPIETIERHIAIAYRVRELARDRPTKAAIADAATEFNCKERTVREALRKLGIKEAAEAEYEGKVAELFKQTLKESGSSPEEVEAVLEYARHRGLIAKKSAT